MKQNSDFLKEHNTLRYREAAPMGLGDSVRISIMQEMVKGCDAILDVGCWDGLVSREMVKRGCRVWGLDNSPHAVSLANQNGLIAQIAQLDDTWPIEDKSMDAVLAGEVIEHVIDIDTFISEAHRVLRPHGLLVVSTPNLAALGRRLMLLLGMNPHIEISFSGGAAGHVRYFTPRIFREFIESKGFQMKDLRADIVNFNSSGSIHSTLLARLFPRIGRCLIGSFQKT